MAGRKIWVKRANASATQVTVGPDDLVDDVRDAVIRKYLNSLGRTFDAPDVCLKICPREQANKVGAERTLGPDEPIIRLIDTYFPGGQSFEEALIIDVPQKRTPKASPRYGPQLQSFYIPDDGRAGEAGDYFSAVPAMSSPIAGLHGSLPTLPSAHPTNNHLHSMAVLTTGQVPPLPSPGGRIGRHRPKAARQRTTSPTALLSLQTGGSITEHKQSISSGAPQAPPLPTPPAQAGDPRLPTATPPARTSSPQPNLRRKNGKRKGLPSVTERKAGSRQRSVADQSIPTTPASAGIFEASVPPINVLLVEDNVINLKLLEAFMKRLKVRWKTAMNGKEAVAQWRTGGFHLVLMDIQLPVMNGLAATKEIRRLEALNNIGKLAQNPTSSMKRASVNGVSPDSSVRDETMKSEDLLEDKESLFKSSVIIVALTASSLQSDRHEALAAGCNDFLTKPVSFVWLERKVTEWGCMQALIDFDGWRKWKDLAAKETAGKDKKGDSKAEQKAALKALFSAPPKLKKDRDRDTDAAPPSGGPSSVFGANNHAFPVRTKTHSTMGTTSAHSRKSTGRSDSLDNTNLNGSGSSYEMKHDSSSNTNSGDS